MPLQNRVIICPKNSVNKNDILYFSQKVGGRIVEAIGADEHVNLVGNTDYYIVYQYPPGEIRSEFKDFCETNRELVDKADLLIMAPVFYADERVWKMKSEYDSLNAYYSSLKGSDQSISVLITSKLNKERQMEYADSLEYRSETFDENLKMGHTKIMFFEMPLGPSEVSLSSNLKHFGLGVCAIIFGIVYTIFINLVIPSDVYYGRSDPRGFGFFFIVFGVLEIVFVLIYRKYASWLRHN